MMGGGGEEGRIVFGGCQLDWAGWAGLGRLWGRLCLSCALRSSVGGALALAPLATPTFSLGDCGSSLACASCGATYIIHPDNGM